MAALQNKTVVFITGGNTGLGYEIVKALLEDDSNAYVILLGSRSIDRAKLAIDKLQKEVGTQSIHELKPYQIDYASNESIKNCYEQIKNDVQRLDVLINNGGMCLVELYPCKQHE